MIMIICPIRWNYLGLGDKVSEGCTLFVTLT